MVKKKKEGSAPQQKSSKGSNIMRCNCSSEFQDSRYGKGMRVHNYGHKDSKWVCTVCGLVKK